MDYYVTFAARVEIFPFLLKLHCRKHPCKSKGKSPHDRCNRCHYRTQLSSAHQRHCTKQCEER